MTYEDFENKLCWNCIHAIFEQNPKEGEKPLVGCMARLDKTILIGSKHIYCSEHEEETTDG